jgi:hypothetical protein
VFRVKVGWVAFSGNLAYFQLAVAYPLLYPQACAFEMPQLTQALTAADANGGRAIRPKT